LNNKYFISNKPSFLIVGINIPLLDYLSISQKAGVGVSLFYNTDPRFGLKNNRSYEFDYMLSIALLILS